MNNHFSNQGEDEAQKLFIISCSQQHLSGQQNLLAAPQFSPMTGDQLSDLKLVLEP